VETKVCSRCKNGFFISEFHKQKNGKFGVSSICKSCRNEEKRKYYRNNEKQINEQHAKYYQNNREQISEKHKLYRKSHKEEKRKYENNRLKTDINFKLASKLRDRLRKAIKNNQKSGSSIKDLGCSVKELKQWFEQKFQPGMTWENYGSKWHIDHIKPLVLFNLEDREQFLEACNYKNLQPLWAKENLRKGKKYDKK